MPLLTCQLDDLKSIKLNKLKIFRTRLLSEACQPQDKEHLLLFPRDWLAPPAQVVEARSDIYIRQSCLPWILSIAISLSQCPKPFLGSQCSLPNQPLIAYSSVVSCLNLKHSVRHFS